MPRSELLYLGLTTSLVALACGDDSPTRGDSGQSATASDAGGAVFDAATGAPEVDAALPPVMLASDAARPDGGTDAGPSVQNLSCEQLSQAASTALRAALDESYGCTLDSECTQVGLRASCHDGCAAIVSTTAAQRLQSAIDEQDRTTCAAFGTRGCKFIAPPCTPLGEAACIAGECRDYRGSLPVARPDGGTAVTRVVLDNPASPAQAEVSAGQRLELTLRSVFGGAYTEPTVSAVALRFVESFLPRLQNPGGPSKVFVFEAISPGTVQVTVPHSTRPDAFKLTVAIR
jgi:hypothetical protein